ncbi:hypothetical protein ACJ72_07827 [Emergomyces africanus]|uniref:Dolichyl-diphosphooligosaccharide--protein glycosyltransferase subunit 4 n=1 Tax=Emergomyces africanus TaxID=1955775 RepID=A0A1B7NMQ2_9EURO|nr:hypothetical protein ACJ72_07827 [Emergomyces africanus]
MISDDQLYQLAIFLGSCAMLLIVLYHYLEVNAKDSSSSASSISSTNNSSVQSHNSASSSKNSGSHTSVNQDAVGAGLPGRKG